MKGMNQQPPLNWPVKEVKPPVEDNMHDDSILARRSEVVFGPPYSVFTNDFADYFNPLGLHPAEYWKLSPLWSSAWYLFDIWSTKLCQGML